MNRRLPSLLIVAVCLGACEAQQEALNDEVVPSANTPPNATPSPGVAECTEKPVGRAYLDFGGVDLQGSRANEALGTNRRRVKPFSVLAGDYARVLGSAPASLAAQGASFPQSPPRGFTEPKASAVGLSGLYGAAFEGSLAYAKGQARLAVAPDAQTARAECTAFLTRVFSATPESSHIEQCTQFAIDKVAKEPNPQRKWAYTFAGVLTSSPFLTY